MTISRTLAGAVALALVAAAQSPALAEGAAGKTSGSEDRTAVDQVWSGISKTVSGVGTYTARQRDKAEAEAKEAMAAIDEQIEGAEQTMREQWASLSESTREQYRKRLQDLRHARNELGEQYGALENSTDQAWDDLADAFSEAGSNLEQVWRDFYGDRGTDQDGGSGAGEKKSQN